MKVVGLRELKNRLSEYIRDVRRGESLLVTDRGEVVAELAPPGHRTSTSGVSPAVQALARNGLATPGLPNSRRIYRRLPPALKPGRAEALLAAERGER
jgi:prevent-host-death family protein